MKALARTGYLAAAAFSALGALASAAEFRKEYEALGFGQRGISFQVPMLADVPPDLPSAFRSRRNIIDACDQALRGPYGAMQPAELRHRLSTSCGRLAALVLDRSPSDGLAWLVHAESALARDDTDDFIRTVARSQLSAPSEGWIAERRIDLAAQAYERAPRDIEILLRQDIGMLFASSVANLPFLARQFAQRPALRPMLTDSAEVQPADIQTRFLKLVRQIGS